MKAQLGWSLPLRTGRRGAGLGNEALVWGKAYIAAQELGFRVGHPAWGLNTRPYSEAFGTTRLDWVGQRLLRSGLPTFRVTEAEYRETGETDYALAIRRMDERHDLRSRRVLVVEHEGMWGGYLAIRRARRFLWARLLSAPGVLDDLYTADRTSPTARIRVAVHMRAGDFSSGGQAGPKPGEFNTRLPMGWYTMVCRSLSDALGGDVAIEVFGATAKDSGLDPVDGRIAYPRHLRNPDLADLVRIATADLIVCSVSSYSLLAAFLSDSPYLWYRPHLTDLGGWLSLWGREQNQMGSGPTASNLRALDDGDGELRGRGVPFGQDDELPTWLTSHLRDGARLQSERSDLLMYGVVKADL